MRTVLVSLLLALALFGAGIIRQVQPMLPEETMRKHARLIALLFEQDAAYQTAWGYDLLKIAKTLETNGLLPAPAAPARFRFQADAADAKRMALIVYDVLRDIGAASALPVAGGRDAQRTSLTVSIAKNVPSPIQLGERLRAYGVRMVGLRYLEKSEWQIDLDCSQCRLPALSLAPHETKSLLRPIQPIWLDVSQTARIDLRERAGSHWHPSVTVYDKMLRILSIITRQNRTRYLSVSLPEGAAYVRITDLYTLDNLRSGLRITARKARKKD